MKKILSLIIAIVLAISLSALPAMAWEYGEDGTYSWLIGAENPSDILAEFNQDDGTLVIEGKGDIEDFSSSSRIPWSWHVEEITSVTISEGITRIGNNSFYCCTNISSITLPNSISEIGIDAFRECSSLTSITLPNNLTTLNLRAFCGCTGLTDIKIPDGVTNIDNQAFRACTGLTSITIPDSIKFLGSRIFEDCRSDLTVYCYGGGNVEQYLKNNNINYKIIGQSSSPIDLSELKKAIADAEAVDESEYTLESVDNLDTAVIVGREICNNPNITQDDVNKATQEIRDAIKNLVRKSLDSSEITSNDSNNSINSSDKTSNKPKHTTNTTIANSLKATRSTAQVKKDKSAAKKAMKQAKITKLTAKSKAKKKIAVSWKKVKNAKGYQVQVSAKKNFKKVIYNKSLTKNKLTIKSSKIKSKKIYYVRVRAYATYKDANNATKKIYSKWNKKLRKVKVK